MQSLEEQLAELRAEYEALNTKYKELSTKHKDLCATVCVHSRALVEALPLAKY